MAREDDGVSAQAVRRAEAIADGLRGWLDMVADGGWVKAAFGPTQSMRDALARLEGPGPSLAEVRELAIPPTGRPLRAAHPRDGDVAGREHDLTARVYTPFASGAPPAPLLVFFHGGGFVVGDLDTHDNLCRRLAAAARVRVASVAYRLAPEHRFPAAVDDAIAAFDWLAGPGAAALGVDPARVAVGGDSAGGNLAAVVAQQRRNPSGPTPAFQLLLYPWLQLVETNIKRLKALEGHVLSHAVLEKAREAYVGKGTDPHHPLISPLMENDLNGMAPAVVITAGLDPLHNEGRAYADRLAAAGVGVAHRHYPRAPHGFMQATAVLESARQAVAEAGRLLSVALHPD